jgi:hypothetical protein
MENVAEVPMRDLIENYVMALLEKTQEENKKSPIINLLQGEIEGRLKSYEEDANKYGARRKSDSFILGRKN